MRWWACDHGHSIGITSRTVGVIRARCPYCDDGVYYRIDTTQLEDDDARRIPPPADATNFEAEYVELFDGDPLDGTRLARTIADTVPEVNKVVRMDEFRRDLKRRVAARRAEGASE